MRLFLSFFLFLGWLSLGTAASAALAAEEEAGEGAKKKQPEKPKPDSAVSLVLQLPEVQKWDRWIGAKHDGSALVAWGEAIKEVQGNKCWEVAVGENDSNGNTRVWAYFCMMQSGVDVWVEGKPKDPLDPIVYYPYEQWRTRCNPTEKSPGVC